MTRVLCFYLPQFHPIPENDEWWGPGFTEWTNVARARPRFPGHRQPHIPADLGFYDLRLEESRVAQARLAERYGLGGFCYYHYWFNGRRLLERPFDEVLASGRPDFPFALCWANGNWTRRWDGRDREVLIAQEYGEYDPERHMRELARAFADPRYVRVDGRPLFLVYRTDEIPDLPRVLERWRETALRLGVGDPYVVGVQSPGHRWSYRRSMEAGVDAVSEFYPTGGSPLGVPVRGVALRSWNFARRVGRRLRAELLAPVRSRIVVQDYREVMEAAMRVPIDGEHVFPCVMPTWDNSPRRRSGAVIIQNHDASLYRDWLEHAIRRVRDRSPDRRIVFVNAWNEWAEGCHLEPDLDLGHRFLEATRDALAAASPPEAPATRAGPTPEPVAERR